MWADSQLVRWATHVFANAMDVGTYGQLFVATGFELSDCVHLPVGALQRLDYKHTSPGLLVTFFFYPNSQPHMTS